MSVIYKDGQFYGQKSIDEVEEITKENFDNMPQVEKDNGKAYFIPDMNIVRGFTALGNRFDRSSIYSATEKMIGSWIDGKPLYQKTYTLNSFTVSSTLQTHIFESGFGTTKNLLNFFGSFNWNASSGETSNKRLLPYNYSVSGNLIHITVDVINNDLRLSTQREQSNTVSISDIYVTVQYTKTTDTSVSIADGNDFSTDERVIGTWIDGKPLYQKTISCGALPNNTSKVVNHSINNISKIINMFGITNNGIETFNFPTTYYTSTNVNWSTQILANTTYIYIVTNSDMTSFTESYVTLQYTKTTD